ncbi:MAG: putative aminohydrolase SsnA [Limisphaerales bacterium]
MTPPLLIENGTILQLGTNPNVLENHSLLIEDGFIRRIAPKSGFGSYRGKRIDATGKVVMPGLINAHTHFYSSFARGLTKAKPSEDFNGVLRNLWWKLDSKLTTEDCYYSAMVALLDSVRHGTTTFIDHHASPRAVMGSLAAIEKAVSETGLRGCLCYELSDRDGGRVTKQGLNENVAFVKHCEEKKNDHIKALFGLHASFTLTDETLENAKRLAQELGVGFHIHVAEAQSDQDESWRKSRKRVVKRLNDFGILGPRSIAAHCIHINEDEMDLLAVSKTSVVHNPQSNMNNAVGIANVVELVKRGVLVGLGTDAMTTNMLEELRVALWGQHLRAHLPSVGFGEVVNALFQNNPQIASRVFNVPIGDIREFWAGDVILVDYDPPTPMDGSNVFGHVVFGISQATVDTTIVGGQILMENRRLTLNIDEQRINARARELSQNLWKRF